MKTKAEKGLLGGFILAALTIVLHGIHFSLPFLLPVLVALNLSLPHFLHNFHVPGWVTVLSILWMAYYLVRRRIILFYPRLPRRRCH